MSNDVDLFNGTAWYVVFLFSTTLHEASHALAAFKLGDDTAYRGGQVSLDPTPHIRREPFGMVIIPIVSYMLGGWMIGWASAPYDPNWARAYPKRAGWMAMAGPAANLALVLAAAFLIRLGIAVGFFETPDSVGFTHVVGAAHEGIPYLASVLLSLMFSLNLLLCVFNLLPVPPLDGSSLPLLFISEDAAVRYWEFMRSPAVRMVGLVVAWNVFGQLFHPLHLHAINLLYTGLGLHYGP